MRVALTVRKLKPGAYDDWRRAWWPDESDADEMPEGAQIFIVRNVKDPDEIIAFGIFEEGVLEEMSASFEEGDEEKRQEAMAPYIESVGADGVYEVIEQIGAKSGARN